MEPKLFAILSALVADGTVFERGYVMDAGANNGHSTFLLNRLFKNHTVIALDPLMVNINYIKSKQRTRNIETIHGYLGSVHSTVRYNEQAEKKVGSQIGRLNLYDRFMKKNTTTTVNVYTVDEIFKDRKLSFAHWDLEGSELEMLKGASATIRRDLPVFTVETHASYDANNHDEVMHTIETLDYSCETIDERCGWKDCRNHICAPTSKMSRIRQVGSLQLPKS